MRVCDVCWVELRPAAGIMEIGKGKGLLGGWHTLAGKLRGLGGEPQGDAKSSLIPVAQLREKGVVSGSFLEAAKPKPIKSGDSVWRWVKLQWLPKGSLRIVVLGRGQLLFEFETVWEAKQVLARGRRVRENFLCLEKWNPEVVFGFTTVREEEAGCSQAICSKNPKERFAQVEVQSRVQDVTSKDGLLKGGAALVVAHYTGMQAEGPVEAREEGFGRMLWIVGLVVREVDRVGWSSWGPNFWMGWAGFYKKRGKGVRGSKLGGDVLEGGTERRLGDDVSGRGRGEAATTDGIMVLPRLQMPMRLLLVESDSQDRVMGGGKLLSLEDGDRCVCPEVEGLSQEERWTGDNWEDSCLAKFSNLLGFPTIGFEEEIFNLLQKIKSKREKGKKKVCSATTMFDREIKRLECSINYNKGKKESGLDRRGGVKEINLK
ncbi:hypothetical protein AAG906_004933 [Vitis piasezkii]